ncbi:MAG: helix-turn-helix transcriptional regulator [Pseudomonadota bacterium]
MNANSGVFWPWTSTCHRHGDSHCQLENFFHRINRFDEIGITAKSSHDRCGFPTNCGGEVVACVCTLASLEKTMQVFAGYYIKATQMNELASRYLTTRELADLLRIKERKVYELAASGEVPCSRATGKLLFPRDQVEAWLADNSSGPDVSLATGRPAVLLGSHDPLLEWAMRESRCGLAANFDSSLDGLERFANLEGIATGLHIPDTSGGGWNVDAAREKLKGQPVVLVEWARRQRGLIVPAGNPDSVRTLSDAKARTLASRQPEAGSQMLFAKLLDEAGLAEPDFNWTAPVRSETDAALLVQDGNADISFGLSGVAAQLRLEFVPIVEERYDLAVDRQAWFDPPMQALVAFCRSSAFAARAAALSGYDISGQFDVLYNST